MRDRIFTGQDVEDAVAAAAANLGLSPRSLRYVVLEPGAPAGRGGAPVARIAVMLDARGLAAARAPSAPGLDPVGRARRLVREFAESAGVELAAESVEAESADRLRLRLQGPGRELLVADGGRVLLALEHVLQRALSRGGDERRLGLECEGYREARDAWLRGRAQDLAREILRDGRARSTEPLNAYDRRIVHLAVGELQGVRTFSVGEGSDRRVTIARADDGAA